MAQIAAGFASSHGIMVTADLEDWQHHFSSFDRKVDLYDPSGHRRSYDDWVATAPEKAVALIEPKLVAQRYHEMKQAVARLQTDIEQAELDALIIFGDDQNELFDSDNMPAIGIYYGETIPNLARSEQRSSDWIKRARDRRLEESIPRDYPVHAALARHLIAGLIARNFDPATLSRLPDGKGEGHAFSFVHRLYMTTRAIPIVPIFVNTFYAPNQPTPQRCLDLGRAIAASVESFPGNLRVGVFASGGLSHFVVDEELDRGFLAALKRKDDAYVRNLPARRLESGNSELRNWIAAYGAASHLKFAVNTYIPGYRTPALTGTGLCFARWV